MATVDSKRGRDFDPMAPEEHKGLPARVGVGPGLLAGAVMLVILTILAFFQGLGPGWTLKVISTTFLGQDAMEGGFATALLGAVAHFAVSALLGMAFAKLAGRTTRKRLLGLGLLYSIAIWAFVQFIVLPATTPMLATQLGTVWPFFLAHVGFGAMLGASLPSVADLDAPPRPYVDSLRREVRP